jgi:hypothetical protein
MSPIIPATTTIIRIITRFMSAPPEEVPPPGTMLPGPVPLPVPVPPPGVTPPVPVPVPVPPVPVPVPFAATAGQGAKLHAGATRLTTVTPSGHNLASAGHTTAAPLEQPSSTWPLQLLSMPSPVPSTLHFSAESLHTQSPLDASHSLLGAHVTPQQASALWHSPHSPIGLQVCEPAQPSSMQDCVLPATHEAQPSSMSPSQSLSTPSPVPVPHRSAESAQTHEPASHSSLAAHVTPQQGLSKMQISQYPPHSAQLL